jgi:hypothetical protein
VTYGNQILEQQSNGGSKLFITTGGSNVSHRYNVNNSRWWAGIRYKEEFLYNIKTNQVIDGTPQGTEGAQVYIANKSGSDQQKWKIVYID